MTTTEEKKEENIISFDIEEIQRKNSYRYLKIQFWEKIDAVDSKYSLRFIYDDSIFDRIQNVWSNLEKAMAEEGTKLIDNTKALQKEAADEVEQIEMDRKEAIKRNPDIIFGATRYETKEASKGTLVKFFIRDKDIINLINNKMDILHNYKVGLTGV